MCKGTHPRADNISHSVRKAIFTQNLSDASINTDKINTDFKKRGSAKKDLKIIN